MARIRRFIGPAAAIWLTIHTATLILVPAFFIAGSQSAPLTCTCLHDGNHHDCPMHHASPMGARICIQTIDSAGLAVLGSMLGQLGITPKPIAELSLAPAPPRPQTPALPHPRTPAPPHLPPPRG